MADGLTSFGRPDLHLFGDDGAGVDHLHGHLPLAVDGPEAGGVAERTDVDHRLAVDVEHVPRPVSEHSAAADRQFFDLGVQFFDRVDEHEGQGAGVECIQFGLLGIFGVQFRPVRPDGVRNNVLDVLGDDADAGGPCGHASQTVQLVTDRIDSQ